MPSKENTGTPKNHNKKDIITFSWIGKYSKDFRMETDWQTCSPEPQIEFMMVNQINEFRDKSGILAKNYNMLLMMILATAVLFSLFFSMLIFLELHSTMMVFTLLLIVILVALVGGYYIHTENDPYARMGAVFRYWDYRSSLEVVGWEATFDCWVNSIKDDKTGKVTEYWIEGMVTFEREVVALRDGLDFGVGKLLIYSLLTGLIILDEIDSFDDVIVSENNLEGMNKKKSGLGFDES